MCQLTFTNIKDLKLARGYLSIQSSVNTLIQHQDGFGFFTEAGGIFRTTVAPIRILDLGEIILKHSLSIPIMSHVRQATFTNGIKSVKKENTHPFETEKLILMHNGTLELEDTKLMRNKRFDDMIDSQIFLLHLNDRFDGTNFVEAIKSTMEEFNGKFAFLIFDKINKEYYIIRGETATLFRYDFYFNSGKSLGFVVNTDKDSLVRGALLFINTFKSSAGVAIKNFDEALIKELDKETIYKFEGDDLKKIDKIEENVKIFVQTATSSGNWFGASDRINLGEVSESVANFLVRCDLNVQELDILCKNCLGQPLLGCTREDINLLIKYLIPSMDLFFHINKAKEWRKIRKNLGTGPLKTYESYPQLQFPYFINDIKILREIRKSSGENKHNVKFID